MANCKNRKCRAILSGHYWGDGYCSKRCLMNCQSPEETEDDALHDPTDPTGHLVVCRTHREMAAMLDALRLDKDLPKIIYLRKKGLTFRTIASVLKKPWSTVHKKWRLCTRNILRECGLPIK